MNKIKNTYLVHVVCYYNMDYLNKKFEFTTISSQSAIDKAKHLLKDKILNSWWEVDIIVTNKLKPNNIVNLKTIKPCQTKLY